ncbi:sensor histidine kinase [Radiobacillus deserti]|uniref:histidine kinase n=1 Tax=Radiobacillus deserti TaxID=2594883 RepID=A0A516KKJ8_9BACI|nr:ATP-binding protein [Radiobacillus deserti]QDP41906.1 sensor histidine kinase [Radiobacillus deserti]
MFKKKLFRTQQLKFMALNLLAFTIIFSIFGFIIFSQVKSTLYSKTDEELHRLAERIQSEQRFDGIKPGPDGVRDPDQGPDGPPNDFLNPRSIVIDWNEAGEIINEEEIGTVLYENILAHYTLPEENVNTITNTTISESYHFRYLLIEDHNPDDNVAYTQLLVNVDAEQTIIDNFEKIIIICSSIFIMLSITASYLLSKKMMEPIMESWNNQAMFVENASHELRTPLTVIQNKLEQLLTTPQEKISNKFEHIALSLSETRRLTKLTSDLLTLTRADSAETQFTKTSIELDSFIQEVCAPYMEIAESQDKHFWLNLEAPIQLEVDKDRFHQLLVILLDNALKYTSEKDSVGVKTYIEDHKVVLEVRDSGSGIEKENIPYIFDRFYREDKARSRETGGTGLGLSIAQWIIRIHNGTVKVYSDPKKGTVFKLKFPK